MKVATVAIINIFKMYFLVIKGYEKVMERLWFLPVFFRFSSLKGNGSFLNTGLRHILQQIPSQLKWVG